VLEKGSGRFIPSQNNVLLKRDMPKQKTASGIELPRGVFGNTGLATVLEVGPNADPDIKAGDRVYYYSQGALIQPNESVEICYGAEKNSLLEIEDTFVLAKCDE
jgi:co-chaperonin GroES (HSP10)